MTLDELDGDEEGLQLIGGDVVDRADVGAFAVLVAFIGTVEVVAQRIDGILDENAIVKMLVGDLVRCGVANGDRILDLGALVLARLLTVG